VKIVTVKFSPEAIKESPFPAERQLMRRNVESVVLDGHPRRMHNTLATLVVTLWRRP
jgi:hypothetical protein